MSTVREEGKDKIIFVTKEDHETPSSAELVQDDPDDPYEERGLILPTGEINWNCPCLGGMASGPCGSDFKDAFSCFHYSKEEVKGSDCLEQFRAMQECMQRFPELYPQEDDKVPPEQSSETEASSPDPAEASSSDPAETSSPDPAEASSPDPAQASSPDPAEASSPDPAETSGGGSASDIEQDLNSIQPNAENSVRS